MEKDFTMVQAHLVEAFFEPRLERLGLSKDQIGHQSSSKLEQSLTSVTDAISHAESFGVLRLKATASGSLVVSSTSDFHFECRILPILLERKKLIHDRLLEQHTAETLRQLHQVIESVGEHDGKTLERVLHGLEGESRRWRQQATDSTDAEEARDITKITIGQWLQRFTPIQLYRLIGTAAVIALAAGSAGYSAHSWLHERASRQVEQWTTLSKIQDIVIDYRTRHGDELAKGEDVFDAGLSGELAIAVLEGGQKFGQEFIDYTGIIAGKGSVSKHIRGQNTGVLRFPFANKRVEVPKALWILTFEGEEADDY